MPITVSALHYYPVKSCAGIDVDFAELLDRGFRHDRGWMLVKATGEQITQRDFPAMCLIKTTPSDQEGSLAVSAPGMPELKIPFRLSGDNLQARVWGTDCDAVDQGDEAAKWFQDYLGVSCRLAMMKPEFLRRVDEKRAPDRVFVTGFADQYPLLLMSEPSLNDLNERLEHPVLMNRFRPNIVVDGCEPFAEDTWKKIRINNIVMRVLKPCARCVMVTIDQADASTDKEPLKTLAEYRNTDGKVMFGQNLVHESHGTVRIGDIVEVLE